ncbi:hypothetical protein NDU88_006505 [Pleurodeles waltl]|uniref:Uncharacterized protein n=1 Tax=Pleurodeles waltl TaxID=8319 RepID=A0AAV7QJ88_PLEWA|nr:hypothetical protein NDU88_006505 [Pleurodeles waltl]
MASPPQLVVSAGNLRFLQPPGRLNLQPCPWPRPRSRACPLCSSGVTRIQCLSLRAPPQCAISPGPSPLRPPGSPQGPTHARPSPLVHARPPGRLILRPAQGRDLDPVPAPSVIPGPRASSSTVSVRFSCARSHLGPLAPASTSAAAGEPARRLPLFCAVRALTTSALGTTQGRGLCHVLRPADSEVPDGQIRHPRGRRRGPHTLGPLLWSRPAARTSFGPGKARF